METRKTRKANLERKRFVFLQIGMIVSLAAVLVAFEWKTPDPGGIDLPLRTAVEPETELIEVVNLKKEMPKPVNTTLINVVADITEDLQDISIDVETGIDEPIPPIFFPDPLPEEANVTDEAPFVIVERMPEFPGGEAALLKYLALNIKYPTQAREAGISGTVYITFIIEKDGSVSSVKVLRGVAGGCSEEAVRVVGSMPVWKPGNQAGKPVRVMLNLPVVFRLVN